MNDFKFFEGKRVYICSPFHSEPPEEREEDAAQARSYAAYYERLFHCTAIVPQGYLPYLLDESDPQQRKLALDWSKQLLQLCDYLVIFGQILTENMKLEIDYAQEKNITIITRPESATAYVAYTFEKRHQAMMAEEDSEFVSIGTQVNTLLNQIKEKQSKSVAKGPSHQEEPLAA